MPILKTTRLEIRPLRESPSDEDARAFFELVQDEGFHRYPITVYRQKNLEGARAWIQEEWRTQQMTAMGLWGAWTNENKTLIGICGLRPWVLEGEALFDLAYRFRESSWGRGFATEAARAMITYGFERLGLDEITATITPDNEPSIRLALKLGMERDREIVLKGKKTELFRLIRTQNCPD